MDFVALTSYVFLKFFDHYPIISDHFVFFN